MASYSARRQLGTAALLQPRNNVPKAQPSKPYHRPASAAPSRYVATRFRHSSTTQPAQNAQDAQQPESQRILSPSDATAEQQELFELQEYTATQQIPPGTPAPHQPSFSTYHQRAHPRQPLKYAQLGHSRFSRGAPHVCYWHLNNQGVFYVKPEWDELVGSWQDWMQEQQQRQQHWVQQLRWGTNQQCQACSDSIGGDVTASSTSSSQRHLGLPKLTRSGDLLSALTAAAAGAVVFAAAAATSVAEYASSVLQRPRDWGKLLLRVLLVAAVVSACAVVAAQLGRRVVAYLVLCYSGLSMT